jgi:hypothetical protein
LILAKEIVVANSSFTRNTLVSFTLYGIDSPACSNAKEDVGAPGCSVGHAIVLSEVPGRLPEGWRARIWGIILQYQLSKKVDIGGGATVTVTVTSSEPIDERDHFIFQPEAATEMSHCLVSMANALRPAGSSRIDLAPARTGADR